MKYKILLPEPQMDIWRSRIVKRPLSREKFRAPTIFLRANNSMTQSNVLKIAGVKIKMESIR